MDSLINFLTSPGGQELTHGVAVFLIAVAAYISWLTHRKTKSVDQKVDAHLLDHALNGSSPTETDDPTPPA